MKVFTIILGTPFINEHHIIITVLGISTCFFALLLAGYSSNSPGLPNIYLTALSYQRPSTESTSSISQILNSTFSDLVGNASLTVRVGYLGLCIRSSGNEWSCHRDRNFLATRINATQDPLNLLSNSIGFRDKTVFSGLIFISVTLGFLCIPLLATFPSWHEEVDEDGSTREVKPFPSTPLLQVICGMLFVASVLTLVSSLWQHIAAKAFATTAQNMAYGSVKSDVGAAAIGLGWASLALYMVAFTSTLVMFFNIRILDQLTDE